MMADTAKKEGWGFVDGPRKWHYFDTNSVALCSGWMKWDMSKVEQGNDDSPDNCATCKKKLAKRKEPA